MKIRWRRGSVRFRISPPEMEAIQQGESVSEVLAFPGGVWRATIAPGALTRLLGDEDGGLTLWLAPEDRERLFAPETEGIYFEGDVLRYYLEKDFPCVHPRPREAQESSETFAPPPGFAARHRGEAC